MNLMRNTLLLRQIAWAQFSASHRRKVMAGHAPEIAVPKFPKAKVAIISSSWHLDICNDLITGATRALEAAEVKKIKVLYVPGSFEIPLAAQKVFEKGYDAVVAVRSCAQGRNSPL
jgi:6,7-dimethyl-8-ribityllumazine synthase